MMAQLSKLPGVGQKSAQRLAFFLLSLPPKEVNQFANTIMTTRDRIRYCDQCFNISYQDRCHICLDSQRDSSQLCVVAEPKDVFALERMGLFKGYYHVLGGCISPIDGIHPDTLRMDELKTRVQSQDIKTMLLAINPTIEGEATIMYITALFENEDVELQSLAYGLPMGADIDYTDEMTLQKAFAGRQSLS